jgi:DNA helicase-2/ATP-dependent DNA helicase PcrA
MSRPGPDKEQLPAATSTAARTYVKAAPGSGKTFLAVERFGWLRYHHLRSEQRGIAAVSFARSASAELRTRIGRRWGASALGWPAFADTFDELLRLALRDLLAREQLEWPGGHVLLETHDTWMRFPNVKQNKGADEPLRAVADATRRVVPVGLGRWPKPPAYFADEDHYVARLAEGQTTHDEVRSVLASVLGVGDVVALDLSAEVGQFLARNFAHVLVDEAFDLNELDARVLEVAAGAGLELTLVGDPWQSIFEFRGAAPRSVARFIRDMGFQRFDVISSHRYQTAEMQDLARRLVSGDSFQVQAAPSTRTPNVVIADRWLALWNCDLPVLPLFLHNKVKKTTGTAALLVLLNDLATELFGESVSDLSNAVQSLRWTPDRRDLLAARDALADPSVGSSEIWQALRSGPAASVGWLDPGVAAGRLLTRLMELVRSGQPLIRGLSVHQSKGLQWEHVDYLTDLPAGFSVRLDRDNANDRKKYVALTRAERTVRVRELPDEVKQQMRHDNRG